MILFLIFLDISQLFSTNIYLIPTHQSEREKANFLWDTWSQSATYFQTAAHAQSGVTCSEESAVCPLLHTWDHNTHDWLVPLWLTGEREYSPHTQSSQPILLSWTPDWNIIWIQACYLQLIRWTFLCCTTFFFIYTAFLESAAELLINNHIPECTIIIHVKTSCLSTALMCEWYILESLLNAACPNSNIKVCHANLSGFHFISPSFFYFITAQCSTQSHIFSSHNCLHILTKRRDLTDHGPAQMALM